MGKIARLTNDGKLLIKGKLIEKVKEEPLLYFNGTGRAVTIANTNNRLQPSDTFTWEMWFKLDGYTQYNTLMGFNANNLDFGRMDSVNNLRFHIYDNESTQHFLSPRNIPNVNDEVWHHIAISWDNVNGTKFCLIDGILRDEGIVPIGTRIRDMSTQSTFTIGGAGPTNRLIKGWIKDVRMWNVARTQEEILADMSSKLIGDEEGLLLYLPLDEGKGETVVDKASGFEVNINDATWQRNTKTLGLDVSGNINLFGELIEVDVKIQSKNLVQNGNYEFQSLENWIDVGPGSFSWNEENQAFYWQKRDENFIYQTVELEPNTEYTFSANTLREYGTVALRILRSLDSQDYIAELFINSSTWTGMEVTFTTTEQTEYYVAFCSIGVNRRGYAKEIQLEKGYTASEYASYGEVWVEDNFPLMRFKDGKVYIKGELVEGGV